MFHPRKIIEKIKKLLSREEFIVLTGARQTGKTTILLILKQYLEEKGKKCSYLNLENTEYLSSLNESPYSLFDFLPESKTKQYVFIDEIQYLENPTNFLKLLYDEKRSNLKIICSGSSSFYIDKKFKDSLAGRKFLFEIFTLGFDEFLLFKKKEDLAARKNKKLSSYYSEIIKELWHEYLVYGGYPKVVLAEGTEMKTILLEEIGTSYVKKDINDAGIKNTEKYFSLLKIFAGQTGQLVNLEEIAGTLSLARKTVEEYVYTMEKSYHIALIKPFFRNLRKELTKMPKIYFLDNGLRNFFADSYDTLSKRMDKGQYLENIACREFALSLRDASKIKYWRTQDKKEIDFVVGKEAYEIKNSKVKNTRPADSVFTEEYPDIPVKQIDLNDMLDKFYQFRV